MQDKSRKSKTEHTGLVKRALIEIEGGISNLFTIINHKMTIICLQRLGKHIKWKFSLLWQQRYSRSVHL